MERRIIMARSITPTLSSSSGYLVDVRDQVSNLVRFLIMNPGGTSDLWEGDLISFRYISSQHEHDRSALCSELRSAVHSVLSTKFTDYNFDIDFTSEDYDETNSSRYTVLFHININKNNVSESAIVSGSIYVDPKTNNIELKYDRSIDNATFS